MIRNRRCRIVTGEVKAIRAPRGRNDTHSPQAFSFCTGIRHALVESGVKIVGEAAWMSCRQLQIVHLPDTVVSLLHGAFSWCQILRVVFAPGCKHFGTKVFEECRSLTRVGTAQCPSNRLAPQAQLRPRAFQACTALSHINLCMPEPDAAHPNRCLPDCCFLEAGIVALALPTDFNKIGSAACASRQQLQTVDLSQTEDHGVRSLKCTSLQEVSTPPSLLYMARCAFAGCTQLRAICKQGKSKTRRGTYARPNAFDKCEQLDQPEWHRVLPADANDLWREDFLEPAPKASNAFAAGMVHKHSARKLRQVKCANIE